MNDSKSVPPILSKFIWLGIACAALLVLVYGFYVLFLQKTILYGAVFNPPPPAAEIIATDSHGNPFQLSTLRGKVVMIYFGYTHCPMECPMTMANFKEVFDNLGTASNDLQVVLISTDPQRDTPSVLNDYLGRFNPTFLGITGTPEELSKIYQEYGIVVLDGGVTHSSFTYVVDRKGNLRLTYVPDSTPEDITHDLRIILAEN